MNEEQNLSRLNINWYPGHMAKAKREILNDLKLIDVVIELLDARIPLSSQNPDFRELIKNKKQIIVLNKCDLADEKENLKWVDYFKKKNKLAILTDANSGKGIENLIKAIEEQAEEQQINSAKKGRTGRKIKAMILGIPNVGKSSLINRIAKKVTVNVGNKPGVTRKNQWIRINEKIELLDTPGVLWPKFINEETALNLAYTGTIKEEILDKLEIAYNLTKFMLTNYIDILCKRYKLDKEEIVNIMQNKENPENENIYQIMLKIGKNRGCIISGGNIDEEKTARIILDEFKNGVIGKITIEKVK